MPEWISVWIAKIFGSEPVVKVMYVIIGWALLIMFMPASFAESIYERSNIPFSGQLCLFALAFIIVDGFHRTMNKWTSHRKETLDKKSALFDSQKQKLSVYKVIDNLDPLEKSKLKRFIELDENTLWFYVEDVPVTSLSQKGIIICAHNCRRSDGRTEMTYRIDDEYFEAVKEYFKYVKAL